MPFVDPKTAKVKMVVYFGSNNKHVRYNIDDQNNDKTENIIAGMERRFKANFQAGKFSENMVKTILFYEHNVLYKKILANWYR